MLLKKSPKEICRIRIRNNRIVGADFLNRCCAFDNRLESMLLGSPLKTLFRQYRPRADMALPFPLRQRLGHAAGRVDEQLCRRTERAVLQGKDPNRHWPQRQFNGHHLDTWMCGGKPHRRFGQDCEIALGRERLRQETTLRSCRVMATPRARPSTRQA